MTTAKPPGDPTVFQRAYSVLTVKEINDDARIITGIATTPSTDRMGDQVLPTGAEYKLPIPLLWQHNSSQPIGHVTAAKITKAGIEITAQIARNVTDSIEEAWKLIRAGLVRGLSIGFRPLDTEAIPNSYGVVFKKWEWLELSAVTVPANSDCDITTIRSIDEQQVKAASGRKDITLDRPKSPAGVSASDPSKAKTKDKVKMAKTASELIASFEATRVQKNNRLDDIMKASGETGETLAVEQADEYDMLEVEIKEIDTHLDRLRRMEARNKASATEVKGNDTKSASESRAHDRVPAQVRANLAVPKGYGFVRLLSAKFQAREQYRPAADIARERGWGDELANVLTVPQEIITRAAIAPANTTDSTWAGPLVTYNNLQEEFIELLRPLSVIERIPGLRRVPFNIKVPRETTGTTAYWVGQGSPKPVSKGALDTVTLDFNKVAGITFQTQELLRFSRPNSEQIMINSLTKAISYLTDRDFLDPSKAISTGVSPASVTNGSSSVTASGITADAFRADLGHLLFLYTSANYNLSGLVFVMTQSQAMRLALLRTDFGQREFPDITVNGGTIEGFPVVTSENIVANGGSPADGAIIVAMNANDILLADEGQVEVDVSTEASIQADSAPDSPMTASSVLVSLWQNNLVAIRCERYISWTKARTDSVVYILGANYG